MMSNASLLNAPADNTSETVVSDLEGTISACSVWEGMRDFLFEQGEEQRYKRFFLRKMPRYALHKLGLISRQSMKENWIMDQLRLFEGCTGAEMAEMGQYVVENCIWPKRRRIVIEELSVHQAHGRRVIINTGQFEAVLAELLKKLDGFEAIGTPLLFQADVFSGRTAGPLNVGERKAERLQPFLRDGRILSAYGDTSDDLPMMLLSHQPVAVYPDQKLRAQAGAKGWRILEGDSS